MNGDTIYHVFFGGDDHHYFGSITAIYDTFTTEQIGVNKERLWGFGITPEKPYRNKKCVIYKGVIHRTKTNRKLPKQ